MITSRHEFSEVVGSPMDYPLRPDGIRRRPTAQERKAIYYHGFHDTPDANCNACAWEDTI